MNPTDQSPTGRRARIGRPTTFPDPATQAPLQFGDNPSPWAPTPQNPALQIPGPMAAGGITSGALIPPAGPTTPDLQSLLLNRAMGAQAQPTNLTN